MSDSPGARQNDAMCAMMCRLHWFRDRLCLLICGKRLFNSDMSRELDALQKRLDELEGR